MSSKISIATLSLMVLLHAVTKAEWPQFFGPNRNGLSTETGLARSWPETGPPLLWNIDVGPGFGSAAILDGKVYFLDRLDDEFDVLRCVDLNNGKEIWRYTNPLPGRTTYNGSRAVPTLDEQRVYTAGPFGQLYCLDHRTHKLLWQLDIAQVFQIQVDQMGFVCNPLLYGDTIIIPTLSEKAGLIALSKTTGEIIWQSRPLGTQSYVSPVLTRLCDREMVLYLSRYQASGIDPKNGELLWTYDNFECEATIAFPTIIGGHRIFITGGYNDLGSIMLSVTSEEDQFHVKELFRIKQGSQIHPVILYQNHLYGNFNDNVNLSRKIPEGLVCLDLQGQIQWQTKSTPPIERGSLIIANDMIFVLGGETGVLSLFDANSRQSKLLAQAKVLNAKKEMFAPLALSDGKLIIRDHHEMKCLDVRCK